MNNETIGNIAVSSLNSMIETSDYLRLNAPSFSNEPSWDGVLYYYPETNKSKNNLVKIDIQVKGSSIDQDNFFSFETSDLKNYCNNNGVLLVVVKITLDNGNISKKRILVSLLMPNEINAILEGKENQKTINIKLKQIFNSDALVKICKIYQQKRKDTNLGIPLTANTKFNSDIRVDSITTIFGDEIINGIPITLDNSEMYISIKTAKETYYINNVSLDNVENLKIEDALYKDFIFKNVVLNKRTNQVELKLSDGLSIVYFGPDKARFKLNFKASFDILVQGIKFILDYEDNEVISIGDTQITFKINEKIDEKVVLFYVQLILIYDYIVAFNLDKKASYLSFSNEERLKLSRATMLWCAERLRKGEKLFDKPIKKLF